MHVSPPIALRRGWKCVCTLGHKVATCCVALLLLPMAHIVVAVVLVTAQSRSPKTKRKRPKARERENAIPNANCRPELARRRVRGLQIEQVLSFIIILLKAVAVCILQTTTATTTKNTTASMIDVGRIN